MRDLTLRLMGPADVPAAERLSAEAFHDVDTRMFRRSWPEPEPRPAARGATWMTRTMHLLETDPGGCWVAEDEASGLLGMATSFVRDQIWGLATYAVRPALQGRGIGRPLLDAALGHGRGRPRGMISSSSDPKAVRRYRLAGFSLHPQMFLTGTVDRSALPGGLTVRDGSAADVDLLDSIDRDVRGAGHGPDHEVLLAGYRLVVSETSDGSGYAYVDDKGTLGLLAATDRRTASGLLWEALATTTDKAEVFHITAANEWAIDVGMAARLELHQEGYLALRGMAPPSPYLHHGALL